MLYFSLLLAFLSVIFIIIGLYNILFAKRIGVVNRLGIYTKDDDIFEDKEISFREFIINY